MKLNLILTLVGLFAALEDANSYLKGFIRQAIYWLKEESFEMAEKVFSRFNVKLWQKSELYRTRRVVAPCVVAIRDNHTPIIVPSGSLYGDKKVPEIYQRPSLFSHILELHWLCSQQVVVDKVNPVTGQPVYSKKNGKIKKTTLTIKAPQTMEFNGESYKLIAGGKKKDYYWPVNVPMPKTLVKWVESTNSQSKNDLQTMLKRHGWMVNSSKIKNIKLAAEKSPDLGLYVAPDKVINEINKDVSFDINYSQVTILFEDGSYFKGGIISQSLANMKPGFYGGIKSPITSYKKGMRKPIKNQEIGSPAVVMNILANYRYKWDVRANSQQFTYAGLNFPLVSRNDKEMRQALRLAALGEPGYVLRAQEMLLSNASDMMHRFNIKGHAGQLGVICTISDAKFIVFTNNKSKNGLRKEMVFLWSPALPVHQKLMKVMIEYIYRPEYDGIINLNINKGNLEWITKWFIQYAGRDADGDGIILTDDIRIMRHAADISEIRHYDTTQHKGSTPYDENDSIVALNISRDNIILNSHIVGYYDLVARRILNKHPELMTWELAVRLTKNIQMGISSVKKMVEDSDLANPFWIYNALNVRYEDAEWLRRSSVDAKREIAGVITQLNSLDAKKYQVENKISKFGPTSFDLDMLNDIEVEINNLVAKLEEYFDMLHPEEAEILREQLSLIESLAPKRSAFYNMKNIGKKLSINSSVDDIAKAEGLCDKINELWKTEVVSEDTPSLTRNDMKNIIEDYIMFAQESIPFEALWGTMLQRLSSSIICQILDVKDMLLLDQKSGLNIFASFRIPVVNAVQPGAILTYNQLQRLVMHRDMIGDFDKSLSYKVESVEENHYYSWVTKTNVVKTSNAVLNVVPLINN